MIRTAAAVALSLLLFASVAAAPVRAKCCHGCDMFTCTTEQCGKTCQLGPKCKSCWKKDCTNHRQ
jgi:hypothetical protein